MTVPRLVLALGFALVLSVVTPGGAAASVPNDRTVAQIALPTATATSSAGLAQVGSFVTAPITLDGVTLFRIATPVNAPVTQLSIAARVALVQTALAQLVAESSVDNHTVPIFDPTTIRVHDRRVGDAVVLEAVDGKHPDPLSILTVTSSDAKANATNIDALSSEWKQTLQNALERALVVRQPEVERRSVRSVVQLAIALVAVSILVWLLLRSIWRRMAKLGTTLMRDEIAGSQSGVSLAADGERQRRRSLAVALRALKPSQRLSLLSAIAETLLWALAVAWLSSITWSLSLFAQTTPLALTIGHSAVGVATTIVVAALLSRVLNAIIARATGAWRLRRFTNSEEHARMLLRAPTIAGAVSGAKTFALVFVAALSVLGQVGVPIGSVVTIGGLAAIALSLAAQNFVRDFLNGFLVLLEDQYVVGDYVTINAFSGIVERLTLRMVQLRDAAGDLVTIPHSSVVSVLNQSRNWSRVDYRVPVDPAADIQKAIDVVRTQITALSADDDWTHGGAEPIEWIGIDAMSKDWIIVRASVRTAPLRQFELRRQINARVLEAFTAAGIALGAQLPAQ